MKQQINLIRQLQELVLTRDEHHQTGDGSHLDQLNDSIDELMGKLGTDARNLYNRLYKKSHIVVAPMSNGCCAVCGMQVPIAQNQQVYICEHFVTCSSGGRNLYATESDAATYVKEKAAVARDDDARSVKVGISRFTAEELLSADLKATTREEAIAELAGLMEKAKFIANADSLVTAAMEREAVLSTALGNDLAFPHVRGVEGGALTLAMGISKKGIDWGDGETAHIIFLSAIPVAVSEFYLRLMSGLMKSFEKAEARNSVIKATSQAALWKLLLKLTRTTIK